MDDSNVIPPNHVALLQKIYDAARMVAANPESQLLALPQESSSPLFTANVYSDETWLRGVSPAGNA